MVGIVYSFSGHIWGHIGVNISERKSGTERTKKRKNPGLIFLSTARVRNR